MSGPVTDTAVQAEPQGVIWRFLDGLFRVSGALAGLSLIAIAVLTLAQIVGRNLGVQIRDADVIAGFAMATCAFLAMPVTLRSGRFIRITLVLSRLKPGARRFAEGWCLLFGLVLVGSLAVFTVMMVVQSYQFGDVAAGLLGIPLWIPQVSMATGFVLLTLAFLEELVRYFHGRMLSYQQAEASESK